MNTSLKKACIFGLGAGVSIMVRDQIRQAAMTAQEIELTCGFANELEQAADHALQNCDVKIDKSLLARAKKKIDQVAPHGSEFDIIEMLSFLLLGLQELAHFCKNKLIVQQVEDAALNFLVMYDPNLDDETNHAKALAKYNEWISS